MKAKDGNRIGIVRSYFAERTPLAVFISFAMASSVPVKHLFVTGGVTSSLGKGIMSIDLGWMPDDKRELTEPILERANQSIRYLRTSPHAAIYNDWFFGWRLFRPLIGVAFLVGAVLAFLRRDWGVVAIAALVLVHTAALSVLLFLMPRYTLPMTTPMVLVCLSLFREVFPLRRP